MTRNYSKVPDEKRQLLIDMIKQNMTIKDAARLVEIKYENAKAIYRVYRREQRTDKRKNRFRAKIHNSSHDKMSAQSPANKKGKRKETKNRVKLEKIKEEIKDDISDNEMESEEEEEEEEEEEGAREDDYAMDESEELQEPKSCFTIKPKNSTRPGLRSSKVAVKIEQKQLLAPQRKPKQKATRRPCGKKPTTADHIYDKEGVSEEGDVDAPSSNDAAIFGQALQHQSQADDRAGVVGKDVHDVAAEAQNSMAEPKNKAVLQLLNNLPPEPIKYGHKFFQMFNTGNATQSKAQMLKALAEQQQTEQQQPLLPYRNPYQQKIEEHDKLVQSALKKQLEPVDAALNSNQVSMQHRQSTNGNDTSGTILHRLSGQLPSYTVPQNNVVPQLLVQKATETQQLDQLQNAYFLGGNQEGSSMAGKLRLSQQLGATDFIQYWQMQALSANQKSGELANTQQISHFSNGAQGGANIMLSQEMLDFRQRTLVNDIAGRNNISSNNAPTLPTVMQAQPNRSGANGGLNADGFQNSYNLHISNRRNLTNEDLNQQLQQVTQKLSSSMMLPAGNTAGLPALQMYPSKSGQADVQQVQTASQAQSISHQLLPNQQQQQNQARYTRPQQAKKQAMASDQGPAEEEKVDASNVRNTGNMMLNQSQHQASTAAQLYQQSNWMVPPLNMQQSSGLLAATRVSSEFKDPALAGHQFGHSGKTFAEAVQAAHHQHMQPHQQQHHFALSRQQQAHHQAQPPQQHQTSMLNSGNMMNIGLSQQQQVTANDFAGLMNCSPVHNRLSNLQQNNLNFGGTGSIDHSGGLVNQNHNSTSQRGQHFFEPASPELSREPMQQHTSPHKRPSILHSVTGLVHFVDQAPGNTKAQDTKEVVDVEPLNQHFQRIDGPREVPKPVPQRQPSRQPRLPQLQLAYEMPLQQQASCADHESQLQSIQNMPQSHHPQDGGSMASSAVFGDKFNTDSNTAAGNAKHDDLARIGQLQQNWTIHQKSVNPTQFEPTPNQPVIDEEQPKFTPRLPYLGVKLLKEVLRKPKQLSLRHVQPGQLAMVNEGKIVKIPQQGFQHSDRRVSLPYNSMNEIERQTQKLRQLSGVLQSQITNQLISDEMQDGPGENYSKQQGLLDQYSPAARAFYANVEQQRSAKDSNANGDEKVKDLQTNTAQNNGKVPSNMADLEEESQSKVLRQLQQIEFKITSTPEVENFASKKRKKESCAERVEVTGVAEEYPVEQPQPSRKVDLSAGTGLNGAVERLLHQAIRQNSEQQSLSGQDSQIIKSINRTLDAVKAKKSLMVMDIDDSSSSSQNYDDQDNGSSSSVSAASDAHQEIDEMAMLTVRGPIVQEPRRTTKQNYVQNNVGLIKELSQDNSLSVNQQLLINGQGQQIPQQPVQKATSSIPAGQEEALRLPSIQQVALYYANNQTQHNQENKIDQHQQQLQVQPSSINSQGNCVGGRHPSIVPPRLPEAGQLHQSEITRYLANSLEQMQIKLKYLGYSSDKLSSIVPSQGSASGSNLQGSRRHAERAFLTIDNFSSEVLALHKSLHKLRALQIPLAQETIDNNQKMLSSLTAIIELLHGELSQARGELATYHEQPQQAMIVPQNAAVNELFAAMQQPQTSQNETIQKQLQRSSQQLLQLQQHLLQAGSMRGISPKIMPRPAINPAQQSAMQLQPISEQLPIHQSLYQRPSQHLSQLNQKPHYTTQNYPGRPQGHQP